MSSSRTGRIRVALPTAVSSSRTTCGDLSAAAENTRTRAGAALSASRIAWV